MWGYVSWTNVKPTPELKMLVYQYYSLPSYRHSRLDMWGGHVDTW